MNPPSDAAMKLAGLLENKEELAHLSRIGIARLIDEQLQLPEKHAALLLAQALVDDVKSEAALPSVNRASIDLLRTALSKIR